MTNEEPLVRTLQPIHDPEGAVFGFVERTPGYAPRKGHVEIVYRHHVRFPDLMEEWEVLLQAKLDNQETPG